MKILILLLICLLTSCKVKTPNDTIFVASMCIDKTDEIYNGYFYIPSSIEVGSDSSKSDAKGKIGEAKAYKIVDLFYEISFSASVKINFAHISTLILHTSVLNYKDINDLLQFLKNSNRFDFNFYILSTNVRGKEIYSLTSPNNEKLITTMISEPQNAKDVYVSAPPLHYLNFCRDYYENKVIKLPLIEIKKEWKLDEEVYSYMARGITFVNKDNTKCYSYNELDFRYLNSTKGLYITFDNVSFTILNYKIKIKYKDTITIIVTGKLENYNKNININPSEIVENKIREIILNIGEEIDFLNLKYYDSVLDSTYNIKDIKYKINIRK